MTARRPATVDDVIGALRLTYAEVRALRGELATLRAEVAALRGPAIASDSDLDGERGNPEIKKDPTRWKGAPLAPIRMSEAPVEWLDLLADTLDFKAGKAAEENRQTTGGKPLAPYILRDAARARGWARRKRAGWTDPNAIPSPFAEGGPPEAPPAAPEPAPGHQEATSAPGWDETPAELQSPWAEPAPAPEAPPAPDEPPAAPETDAAPEPTEPIADSEPPAPEMREPGED